MPRSKSKTKIFRTIVQTQGPLTLSTQDCLDAVLPASVERYDTLESSVTKSASVRVIWALMNPTEALAWELESGVAPVQALTEWKAQASVDLAAARRMRRQLVLVDARALVARDADVLSALNVTVDAQDNSADLLPLPDLVMLALADALLARDVAASDLVAEIDVLRHGSVGVTVDVEKLDAAHREYTALTEEMTLLRENVGQQSTLSEDALGGKLRAEATLTEQAADVVRLGTETTSLQKEIMDLSTENSLMRENIEEHLIGAAAAQARGAELVAECARLGKAVGDRHLVAAQADALQRRIETQRERFAVRDALLGAIILKDKSELEEALGKVSEADMRALELTGEVSSLKGELDKVYGSKSWRVTGPLRAARSRGA